MQIVCGGKLSRLYSNSKHLIIKKKKFAGKPLRLEANPRKPQTFSTANDLHYTVHTCLKVLLTYTRHHRVTNFQGYNILRILWIFQNLKIVRFTSSVVYFLLILKFFHKILRKIFESLKLLPYSKLQLSHPSCEIHKHQ